MALTVQNVVTIVQHCRFNYIISFHVLAHCCCRRIRCCVCGMPAVPGRPVSSSTVLFHIIPFRSEKYTSLKMESCRAWSARGVGRSERRRTRLSVITDHTYIHTCASMLQQQAESFEQLGIAVCGRNFSWPRGVPCMGMPHSLHSMHVKAELIRIAINWFLLACGQSVVTGHKYAHGPSMPHC
jgi:hypothetical protein